MISAMMAITTSISTSVKPASLPRGAPRRGSALLMNSPPMALSDIMMNQPFGLADQLRDRQQSCHDRHDQAPDDRADSDDGKRPDDADDAIEAALQFCFIKFGNAARERRQLPGLLPKPQHPHRHRRQAVGDRK